MLFKRKTAPEIVSNNEKTYEFPFSKSFRGFKQFPLVVQGNREAEDNNKRMYNMDFTNSKIKFTVLNYNPTDRMAILFVDDCRMGVVFDADQVNAIENGSIEKIHFEPRETNITGNGKTETRYRIAVFVKYKDEN